MGLQDINATANVERLLGQYQTEIVESATSAYAGYIGRHYYSHIKPSDYPSGRLILRSRPQEQAEALRQIDIKSNNDTSWAFFTLEAQLLKRCLPLSLDTIERLLDRAIISTFWEGNRVAVTKKVRQLVEREGVVPPSLEPRLNALRTSAVEMMRDAMNQYIAADQRKIITQIDEMLGKSVSYQPEGCSAWTECIAADMKEATAQEHQAWESVFAHAMMAESGKPSAKWLSEAAKLRCAAGNTNFDKKLNRWFALVTLPPAFDRAAPISDTPAALYSVEAVKSVMEYQTSYREYNTALEEFQQRQRRADEKNQKLLKGMVWYSTLAVTPEITSGVQHLTQIAFASVTTPMPFTDYIERRIWATKVGNAGIWALGQMPGGIGVGPLARLRTRLRDRGALKLIAAAIEAAAKSAGMTVEELEDLAVPTGGLEADGTRRETFGTEGSALLSLAGVTGQLRLEWFGADGKPRKAVPAGVKREFAAEVKALKAAEEEIKQTISAQGARLDGFLLAERVWPLSIWRERYINHPIMGNIARRLIWTVGGVPALPVGVGFQDNSGQELEEFGPETAIGLWHPISATPEIVLRWRDRLETLGIRQPFKQAHREIYLLTDAERNTRTYSNRFAAHILKQHQFNSLSVLRGWKNTLRLMVDDEYPPATRMLPRCGLRVEFWVEGIGDDYGTDTNETGTYLWVATDQVRFYRENAPVNYAHAGGGGYTALRHAVPTDPLPLEEVPLLAFSEAMRDVDLFVGVASVGNDPAWADGGPAGRYRNYWQEYAFGDLGETAKTRADVLARLLPRLKIAPHCRLDGRFLIVKGKLRTYKIHLGSGNILMEPNDQYLCIVPGRSDEQGDLFLPFEGDRMLAIILSKAFLLANDTAIKDQTIVSQIKRL